VVPQLFEREIGPKGACKKWFIRLGCICVINFFIITIRNIIQASLFGWGDCPLCTWENYDYMPDVILSSTAVFLIFVMLAILSCLLCAVRKKIRKKDEIVAGRCGERVEDWCFSFWCMWCVQCQVLRHLGLIWGRPLCCGMSIKRRYKLASSTGERLRGDDVV
jgi:magnesium-transporting ATPase (P-type)